MRRLILAAVLLSLAAPAFAETKAYHARPPDKANGVYNTLQRSPQITPSVQAPGVQQGQLGVFGRFFLEDDNLGSVTLQELNVGSTGLQPTTLNTTGFMMSPPGGYLYVRNAGTTTVAAGQAGVGSSAPTTGSIDWGVLTGWSATGEDFCRSTPPFICTFISRIEDASQVFPLPSTTYDLGTWSFDSAGDFAGAPYIQGTQDGGIANTVLFHRGIFKGASLPALPLLGMAAMAGALAIAGGRSVMRRRKR